MIKYDMQESEIYRLHQKYSKGEYQGELLDLVWTHSKIVEEISMLLVKNLKKNWKIKVDKNLVKNGALLHDIGAYDCYEQFRKNTLPYIKHGVRGYEILLKEKLGEKIARFASIHLGIGINKENIIENKLPLEAKDYIPITLEEEIVSYADNFHSKLGPRFVDFETGKMKLSEYHRDSASIFERFRSKFGEPNLENLKIKYNDWQNKMKEWRNSVEH